MFQKDDVLCSFTYMHDLTGKSCMWVVCFRYELWLEWV